MLTNKIRTWQLQISKNIGSITENKSKDRKKKNSISTSVSKMEIIMQKKMKYQLNNEEILI